MIIGNPNIFAIDYEIKEVDSDQNGNKLLYGTFLLHFGECIVGNSDKWEVLGVCVFGGEHLLKHQIHSHTSQFSHLSAQELLKLFTDKSVIDQSKFDSFEDAVQSVQAMSREDFCNGMDLYRSASIETIGGRSFDQVYILMVDVKRLPAPIATSEAMPPVVPPLPMQAWSAVVGTRLVSQFAAVFHFPVATFQKMLSA